MAATLKTSPHKGSDVVYEVCCIICEDDGIHKEALFHCQKCSKYFCDSCVLTHNKFHKDHSVTEKGGGDNWPVTQTVDDALDLCDEHTTEKLTMFCEDDEKLLCHVCHLRNHKQCSHVVLLTDKVKSTTRPLDEAKMKTNIESLMKRLEDMVKIGEENITSLQTSYDKVLKEILDVRQLINDNLDRLQQHTERKLEELHSTLKNSLEKRRKHSVEFISKIKGYNIKDIHKMSLERSFILHRKCYDQTASADLFLRKATTNAAIEFHLNKDLEHLLASCKEFGSIASREAIDPNKIVSIHKSQYNVRTPTDKIDCSITGICESANGDFIIADFNNKCVKLLDQAYNFIEQIQLPSGPWSMCKMSSNEVALTVSDYWFVNEIHFVRVDNRRIFKFNHLQLNHSCKGIAIHQSDLFVTSGTAVYQYTMDGRLVKKLYEDESGGNTDGGRHIAIVVGVGVSPGGKRIYVTDITNGRLLTLTRDGAVTATLQDPAFIGSYMYAIPNVHVAAKGHVFVVGTQSVSQVDTDGKKLLNTIKLDTFYPTIVYFNEGTSKMIFGCLKNVIEFKTNVS